MNFRPYFVAAFQDHLDRLWPSERPEPIASLGRYDAVLRWMKVHSGAEILSLLGHPTPGTRVDAQNLVSFVALYLEKNPTATSRELIRAVHGALRPDPESSEVLLATVDPGHSIVQLTSAADFDREGLSMRHCLRSFLHYFDEHERGEIAILSVREEGTPVATLEVDLRPRPNAHRIVQLQGPENGPLLGRLDLVRGLLRALGLLPHLSGRWQARVETADGSVSMEEALYADALLDQRLSPARHGKGTIPNNLVTSGSGYLESIHTPSATRFGVHIEVHLPALRPVLTVTCGEETWSGNSWVDIERARTRDQRRTDTLMPDPEATLTEAGTRFRMRLAALPAAG